MPLAVLEVEAVAEAGQVRLRVTREQPDVITDRADSETVAGAWYSVELRFVKDQVLPRFDNCVPRDPEFLRVGYIIGKKPTANRNSI